MQIFQNTGHSSAQIVVQQDGARVEVFHPQTPTGAHDRLKGNTLTARQLQGCAFLNIGVNGANTHIEPSHMKNATQLRQVAHVKRVIGLVLGHDQQVTRLGANFFYCCHGCLHCQGQHGRGEVAPTSGVKTGIYRGQFEAGVAYIHRAVKRGGVLHPLQAKPALYGGHRVQNALL